MGTLTGGTQIEIIPAIDLRQGKCVRLYQGDYAQETVFSDDPVDTALKWQSLGAPKLHIVDLDGAATGELANLNIIKQIADVILIPTQLGGGIRNLDTIELVLKAGIERVVLGTAAVENRNLVQEACHRFNDAIIVGIDARDGNVAVRGWKLQTALKATDFARSMVRLGARRFIYTDINRDGTLTEPNFSAIFEMVKSVKVPVIASGGVASLNHLKLLKELGVEGAIVGKALYTGDIKLKQALDEINE
jgi:phosphoribosylformimino-5-aminoimidazole carboxamide ribotide isomerase